jgi:hypothetical protein
MRGRFTTGEERAAMRGDPIRAGEEWRAAGREVISMEVERFETTGGRRLGEMEWPVTRGGRFLMEVERSETRRGRRPGEMGRRQGGMERLAGETGRVVTKKERRPVEVVRLATTRERCRGEVVRLVNGISQAGREISTGVAKDWRSLKRLRRPPKIFLWRTRC